jgi:hypothetical protein
MNASPLDPEELFPQPPPLPRDFLEAVRHNLRQALAWLEAPHTSPALQFFARDLAYPSLKHLPDERAVTDVLAMLHRAIDRGDLFAMSLVYEVPRDLVDGREASASALLPLGHHALAVGATEPLIKIAHAALLARWIAIPVAWIQAILEAESGPEPREMVVGILEEWLQREGSDPAAVVEVLRRRTAIRAKLDCPEEIPF